MKFLEKRNSKTEYHTLMSKFKVIYKEQSKAIGPILIHYRNTSVSNLLNYWKWVLVSKLDQFENEKSYSIQ